MPLKISRFYSSFFRINWVKKQNRLSDLFIYHDIFLTKITITPKIVPFLQSIKVKETDEKNLSALQAKASSDPRLP